MLLRQRLRDPFDGPGAARGALLGVPPLLHGQAEARGHRWSRRALPAPLRQVTGIGEEVTPMPAGTQPRYMGGQAVMEGVMMRGTRSWAVAVRTPEGEIEVVTHDAPTWAERWSKVPILRGIMGLGESMSLGFKALSWSADRQIPEEERISSKAMGVTMAIALAFFTAIFILIPAFVNKGIAD